MSVPLIQVRQARHPGPYAPDRISVCVNRTSNASLAYLNGPGSLKDGIDALFLQLGGTGAFKIVGADLVRAAYHLATPHRNSRRVIEYGDPVILDGPVRLLVASGTHGPNAHGNPLTHLHGVLVDQYGASHGGHINLGLSVLGVGNAATILTLGVGFAQVDDMETGFATFMPQAPGKTL